MNNKQEQEKVLNSMQIVYHWYDYTLKSLFLFHLQQQNIIGLPYKDDFYNSYYLLDNNYLVFNKTVPDGVRIAYETYLKNKS